MTNEVRFHYNGFRSIYTAKLQDDWYRVYFNEEYVAAFTKDEMKHMIDSKRARIVEEDDEAA
jgi:hypothetical protein